MGEIIKVNKISRIYLEIIINNNADEAKAWTRKYFKDASIVKMFLLFDIIGINESKLISNPIQALNQEFDGSG
jgi:hypothetical protein